jgi:hypothetical protein
MRQLKVVYSSWRNSDRIISARKVFIQQDAIHAAQAAKNTEHCLPVNTPVFFSQERYAVGTSVPTTLGIYLLCQRKKIKEKYMNLPVSLFKYFNLLFKGTS